MQPVSHSTKRPVSVLKNLLLWGTVATALAGCGSEDFEVAPTTVKVVCSGKPVTTGTVMLRPIAEGKEAGKPAIGRLEEDGTFVMSTYSVDDGAIVGKHRVIYAPPEGSGDEEGDVEEGAGAAEEAGMSAEQIKKHEQAMKNACVLNEEKIVDVTADGPNAFTVELVPASQAAQ